MNEYFEARTPCPTCGEDVWAIMAEYPGDPPALDTFDDPCGCFAAAGDPVLYKAELSERACAAERIYLEPGEGV